jgi:chromosome segregation ATPase
MDEGTRTSGPAVDEGDRGPAEIRADIAQTRAQLGETVEALAAKTDVKARAKDKVEDARERVEAKVEDARERVEAKLNAATEAVSQGGAPSPAVPTDVRRRVRTVLEENHRAVGLIGAVAAGLLLRSLLKRR